MFARTLPIVMAFLISGCASLPSSDGLSGNAVAPQISFTKKLGTDDGQPTTLFTVQKVTNGPVLWSDLELDCPDGTGPEAWGGDRSDSEGEVQEGQYISCNGSRLTIVHTPTDNLIYDQAT